jgi:uncharacterized protein (DUF488 family)
VDQSLVTAGHGTLGQDALIGLFRTAGIESLIDIRTAPGSRRLPHVRRQEMSEWLPAAGIGYRWEPALGGFRKPKPDSANQALHNDSFRGYADYMEDPRFWDALDPVVAESQERTVAVMCSESVWWRCHRRLVADAALLAKRITVRHLMHDGRRVPHHLTEGVRLTEDGFLRYDAGGQSLFEEGG